LEQVGVAMVLLEHLQLARVFLDYLRIGIFGMCSLCH
jgi:hypothetical protein